MARSRSPCCHSARRSFQDAGAQYPHTRGARIGETHAPHAEILWRPTSPPASPPPVFLPGKPKRSPRHRRRPAARYPHRPERHKPERRYRCVGDTTVCRSSSGLLEGASFVLATSFVGRPGSTVARMPDSAAQDVDHVACGSSARSCHPPASASSGHRAPRRALP